MTEMHNLLGFIMSYFVDLLNEAGLSKSDLAPLLGVSKSTISSWKDRPPQYAIWGLQNYVAAMESREFKLYFGRLIG